jgi:hypothetical protein
LVWERDFGKPSPFKENAFKLIVGERPAGRGKALRAKFAKVPLANCVFSKPLPYKANACKLIVGERPAGRGKALRAKFAKVPLANRVFGKPI